ncbi:alcohol dehydrogenase catalytic domain-containing protein [Sphingomonas aerolata]
MKAFHIGAQNGISGLVATTRPAPVAGPGEALVAPRLVGLISRDVQLLCGTYGAQQPETRIPMSEGVGEVVAIGAGVTEVAVGDRVVCGHFATWLDGPFRSDVFAHDIGITHDGWLAEGSCSPRQR